MPSSRLPAAVTRLRAIGVHPVGLPFRGIRYLDPRHRADAYFRPDGIAFPADQKSRLSSQCSRILRRCLMGASSLSNVRPRIDAGRCRERSARLKVFAALRIDSRAASVWELILS